jgi:uncharacterized protein YbcI
MALLAGPQLAEVTNALVQLQRDIYGRGPTSAKAVEGEGVLTVVMANARTAVEQTLIQAGQPDLVAEVRTVCEHAMRHAYISAVESATGRHVMAFDSEVDVESGVVTHTFSLSDPSR